MDGLLELDGREINQTVLVELENYFFFKTSTFRDLNLQLGPRSQTKKRDMTKSGFNKITPEEHDRRGGSAYRRALHDLCCDIFESAGLEVMPEPLYLKLFNEF